MHQNSLKTASKAKGLAKKLSTVFPPASSISNVKNAALSPVRRSNDAGFDMWSIEEPDDRKEMQEEVIEKSTGLPMVIIARKKAKSVLDVSFLMASARAAQLRHTL